MWKLEKAWTDRNTGYGCNVKKCSMPELNDRPATYYYCGYVYFFRPSDWLIEDGNLYAFRDVLVHGGVTFVKNVDSRLAVVGFDTNHFCDHGPDGTCLWNLDDVVEQTELMAMGVKRLVDGWTR